ncbi:hypothetical protein [Streptomyces sp. NPDC046909]|uniref:hypothetical protein n=1 Tax=Streptomyces sp. NPDC046909 TaxID=3155617 RepID=UPI0033F43072
MSQLWAEGKYEEVEAEARDLEARTAGRRARGRQLATWQCARVAALEAACAQGRRSHALDEADALLAELDAMPDPDRVLLLGLRHLRTVLLSDAERYTEAETEALAILSGLTRLKHLAPVSDLEMDVLANLVFILCRLARHEEAEAIARGNLPRAAGATLASLHCGLVESLNGQGRHDEALTEARRYTPRWNRAATGTLHMATATALHALGHRTEAEATARQALTDCERHLHPEHPRIRRARTLLADLTTDDGPDPTAEETAH